MEEMHMHRASKPELASSCGHNKYTATYGRIPSEKNLGTS